MGAMPNEPSMEEILSSIKRIIAEEDGPTPVARTTPRRAAAPVKTDSEPQNAEEAVLELTDALSAPAAAPQPQADPVPQAAAQPAESRPMRLRDAVKAASQTETETVLSDDTAKAARDSLYSLSRMLVRPTEEAAPANTLEGLVTEMLRPMLKDWLDENLPSIVESMVKREIDRITGRV